MKWKLQNTISSINTPLSEKSTLKIVPEIRIPKLSMPNVYKINLKNCWMKGIWLKNLKRATKSTKNKFMFKQHKNTNITLSNLQPLSWPICWIRLLIKVKSHLLKWKSSSIAMKSAIWFLGSSRKSWLVSSKF